MAKKKNLKFIAVLAFMIAFGSGRAEAFINFDIERVGSAILNGLQQGLQIKNEFDSYMAMAKEAQERGYAQTAQDLFGKMQNGDFDRFGDELAGLRESALDATQSAQAVEERKAKEEADRKAQMEAQLRAEEAARKEAEGESKAAHSKAKAKEPFWKKTYNWLKNNSSTTDAGFNTLDNIKNGDAVNAVRNAADGAGGVVGGEDGQGIGMLGNQVGTGADIIRNGGK